MFVAHLILIFVHELQAVTKGSEAHLDNSRWPHMGQGFSLGRMHLSMPANIRICLVH